MAGPPDPWDDYEVLLSSQWNRYDPTPSGPRRLMLRTMESALNILRKGQPRLEGPRHWDAIYGTHDYKDAIRCWKETVVWAFTERAPNRPFSLDWICDQLGFDANVVRLRLWQESTD